MRPLERTAPISRVATALGTLGVLAGVLTGTPAHGQEAPPLPACGGPLRDGDLADIAWHLLHADTNPEVVRCVTALADEDVARVVGALAAAQGEPSFPGAPTEPATASTALAGPEIPLPAAAQALSGTPWRQWIERGEALCPPHHDCAGAAYDWWSQHECDESDDLDLVLLYRFAHNVTNPDSARVWSEGSGRVQLLLRSTGGLNGAGHTDSSLVRGCLGDWHVRVIGGGAENVRQHVRMRHLPPGACREAGTDCP